MRRLAPRALSHALQDVVPGVAPATQLARVQQAWPKVAGPGLASRATPVSERAGTVTVACESAVWAQELELLGGDLLCRLRAALPDARVDQLRFVVGSAPNHT
jgi:predicted nucleic acid-binding Zn ribbon protein